SNVACRVTVAKVLMEMQRAQAAVMGLEAGGKVAKTQEERLWVDNALEHAQQFQSEQDWGRAEQRLIQPQDKSGDATWIAAETAGDTPRPHLVRREFAATGPHRFVTGVIQDVHCD